MWGHLSDEKLLEAVDETADAPALRHLEACPACAARVAEARRGLSHAGAADVPEPSPLYWESFRSQVGRRLASEPAARSPRVRWLPALAALAAAVVVAIGFSTLGPRPGPVAPPVRLIPAWTPLPTSQDDVGLRLIEALAPSAGDVSPVAACPVEECLASLSEEESRAVAELFKQQLSGRNL
jgi:hypothetical protein